MMQYEYIDVAIGGLDHRNNIMTVAQLSRRLKAGISDSECFATYFRYGPDVLEYVKEAGTIKGYAGDVFATYFPLDIDSDDLSKALDVTRSILSELEYSFEFPGQYCRTYFSGCKGFHILIPAPAFGGWGPSKKLPAVFKELARKIGGGRVDLAIYDRVRMFRLPNTLHRKSGLYKVPLSFQELLSLDVEGIKELAKHPRRVDFVSSADVPTSDVLKQMFRATWREVGEQKSVQVEQRDASAIFCPKDEKPCIYKILAGVRSNRNNAGLRLAVYFKQKGFPLDITMSLMGAWNMRNNEPLPKDELLKLTRSAYSGNYDFGCNDHELQKYCQPGCKYKKRSGVDEGKIYTVERAIDAYRDYIEKLKQLTFVTGVDEIDNVIRGVAPGEVLVIIARPGNYKTAWLQNMLLNFVADSERHALFFSLEMPIPALVERYIAITQDRLPRDIEREFRVGDSHEIVATLSSVMNRLIHVREGGLSLAQVEAYFKSINQMEGVNGNLGLVAIDYLQLMKGGRSKEYENITAVARNVKELAGNLNVPVIILSQTSRKGGDGSTEVTLDMGRGSGAIEEAADFQFGLYRPEQDKLVVKITKNRKGPAHRYFLLDYDPATFYFGNHAEPYSPPRRLQSEW